RIAGANLERQANAERIAGALAAVADLGGHLEKVAPAEARTVGERLVEKGTGIFDHRRKTGSRASAVGVEFHPQLANLLRSDSRTPQVIKIRIALGLGGGALDEVRAEAV